MRVQNCLFAITLVLASCSGPSYQQPNGSFTLQTRAEMLGTDGKEPEEALVVSKVPTALHFAPDTASRTLAEVASGTPVTITAHVIENGTSTPWSLIKAGDKEGYVTNDAIDVIYRRKANLALLRIGAGEPGTPLVADVVLDRNFQLADGTLVPRDQVVLFTQPAFLEEPSWMVVGDHLSAYSRFYDRNSEVTLPPGTRGVVLGVSELPTDPRAVLSPFHSPALVKTQDGNLLFVSLTSLLLHPQPWGDGVVGARSVVRFQLKDAFMGRYGRLEAWNKTGDKMVLEGSDDPGDIASVESRDGPPAGKSLRVVRRLQARTLSEAAEAPPAESVVEDWYRPDPASDVPWGFLAFRNAMSLSFSIVIDGVEETHELKLSGLADRFKGTSGELLGTYSLSAYAVPQVEEDHGEEFEDGDAEPPAEDREFSGSLSFALTVNETDDHDFIVGTDGRFTDVDLPEPRKPESSSEFWDTISSALSRAVGDPSTDLFPIWYP